MAERVDIVDKHDQVTGETVMIPEAHDKVLLHRIAAVLLFRPNGDVLMQRHKHHGRLLDHSVGGHVSAGEDYEVAAIREMQEELGLNIPIRQIRTGVLSEERYTSENTEINIAHMLGVFVGQVSDTWQLVPTEEVDELIEMPLEDVMILMNKEPEQFLQGFLTSMGAYLSWSESGQKIHAHGKNWGEL